MKTCTKCGEEKTLDQFYFRKSKGAYETRCKECIKGLNRAYYESNREQVKRVNSDYRDSIKGTEEYRRKSRAYHARRHRDHKWAALQKIGTRCACCGEDQFEFLTIDHVNSDGHKHRAEIKSANIYTWLAQNDYRTDYGLQTLCFNCNFAKRYNGGVCPHQERSETIRKEYASSEAEAPGPLEIADWIWNGSHEMHQRFQKEKI